MNNDTKYKAKSAAITKYNRLQSIPPLGQEDEQHQAQCYTQQMLMVWAHELIFFELPRNTMVKVKKDYPTDEAVCNQEHRETEESTDSQHIIVPF